MHKNGFRFELFLYKHIQLVGIRHASTRRYFLRMARHAFKIVAQATEVRGIGAVHNESVAQRIPFYANAQWHIPKLRAC